MDLRALRFGSSRLKVCWIFRSTNHPPADSIITRSPESSRDVYPRYAVACKAVHGFSLRSTWDASSSQQEACSECGAQCKRGWNAAWHCFEHTLIQLKLLQVCRDARSQAPNGQRYCWSCWDQWHAMPPPLPAASNFDRGGRRTWRKALPLKLLCQDSSMHERP